LGESRSPNANSDERDGSHPRERSTPAPEASDRRKKARSKRAFF
jgi:hypothetical protein